MEPSPYSKLRSFVANRLALTNRPARITLRPLLFHNLAFVWQAFERELTVASCEVRDRLQVLIHAARISVVCSDTWENVQRLFIAIALAVGKQLVSKFHVREAMAALPRPVVSGERALSVAPVAYKRDSRREPDGLRSWVHRYVSDVVAAAAYFMN